MVCRRSSILRHARPWSGMQVLAINLPTPLTRSVQGDYVQVFLGRMESRPHGQDSGPGRRQGRRLRRQGKGQHTRCRCAELPRCRHRLRHRRSGGFGPQRPLCGHKRLPRAPGGRPRGGCRPHLRRREGRPPLRPGAGRPAVGGSRADRAGQCGPRRGRRRGRVHLPHHIVPHPRRLRPQGLCQAGSRSRGNVLHRHQDAVGPRQAQALPGAPRRGDRHAGPVLPPAQADPLRHRRGHEPAGRDVRARRPPVRGYDPHILRVQHDAASAGPADRDHVVPRGPHHIHHLPADLRVHSDQHGRLLRHGDRRPVPEEQLAPRRLLHVRHGLAGHHGPRALPGGHGHREADGQEGDRTVRHLQLPRTRQPGTRRVRRPRHHDVLHGHRIRAEHRCCRGHRRNRGLDRQQLPEGKGEGHLRGGRP